MDSLGGLPVNVEHVPHAVHTRTRSGTSTSCNKSRPLALKDQETAGAVTRDTAQQMREGASDSHPRVGEVRTMSSELSPHVDIRV